MDTSLKFACFAVKYPFPLFSHLLFILSSMFPPNFEPKGKNVVGPFLPSISLNFP